MKLSEELRVKRTEKITRQQAILDARKSEGVLRAATTEENTEYTRLDSEVDVLDTDIAAAEKVEARSTTTTRTITAPTIITGAGSSYNIGKAIREYSSVRGGDVSRLTGVEHEIQQRMAENIKESEGLLIPYSVLNPSSRSNTTTNADSVDVSINGDLSVLGSMPLFDQMGFTILPGLQGTMKIGRKDVDIAEDVAEEAEITATGNKASFRTLAPRRFGITDVFSKELLAQENPIVHAAYLSDMLKGGDRKLTKYAYAIILAAAAYNEVALGDLTDPGLTAIMAAVPEGGAFAMNRSSFFAGLPIPVDAGSGKFLLNFTGDDNGIGSTHRGSKVFYSDLFVDGANQQYITYGKMSEIWMGFWGAVEVLVNPFTYQKKGQTELTVNRLADVVSRNDSAFARSIDLNAAV